MNPLRLALYINIIILTPLTILMINNSLLDVYGKGLSSNILLSIYLTFLFLSIFFIISPSTDKTNTQIKTLISIQIIYKILSSITHYEKCNPVIISNFIVAFVFIILFYLSN